MTSPIRSVPSRSFLPLALALAAFPAAAKSATPSPQRKPAVTFRPYRRPVTLWVPPYSVAKSKAQLAADFGKIGVKDGITHLDLQFWVPTKAGGAELVGFSEVTEKAVKEFRDWGHARGIRVMLCVYNGAEKWDWGLARAAFADHRDAFVRNLVAETERWGFDGVDIDLEGPDSYEADKGPFVAFMSDLSKELHRRGKQLTVDTFQAYQWNAPNQSWWPQLFPRVDALASMGYEDSGLNAPQWRAYAAQKKAAGRYAAKLQIGVPSDKDRWRGNSALEQLQWIEKDGAMGAAIWDAQLPAAAWKTPPVWQALRKIRGGK